MHMTAVYGQYDSEHSTQSLGENRTRPIRKPRISAMQAARGYLYSSIENE